MKVARLPDLPLGREFEELVAGIFQAAGFFVERDITERQEIEVLQLDAIVTDYSCRPPLLQLVEAKSGNNWGAKDIFKIKGQMPYLNIPRGILITSKSRDRFEAYQRLAEKLGVRLISIKDLHKLREAFAPLLEGKDFDEFDVSMWRFCYWIERRLIDQVRAWRVGQPSAKRFKAILDHAFEINSGVFFSGTVADRVADLYNTYSTYKNLTGRCGAEMSGGDYGDEDSKIPPGIFKKTFYRDQLNELQAACWFEHRARLAILKAAIDYLSYKADGEVLKAEQILKWETGGEEFQISLASFPTRFDRALKKFEEEPEFRQYPLFWQWFLGPFGGFILKDYEEQEYELLAGKTGLSLEQIPKAFDAFATLFPIEGGWMYENDKSSIRLLKLYPSPCRGIGAYYRRAKYTDDQKFDSLHLTRDFTKTDLIRWNNRGVALLTL